MLHALDHCVGFGASGPASFRVRLVYPHGQQSNTNPAAGHEMAEVSACYSGNMRFGTS